MLSFLGGIVSGLIAKAIAWLALIRIGEKQQQSKDQAASLEDAKEANAIRQQVNRKSDSDLDHDLEHFMRRPDAKP